MSSCSRAQWGTHIQKEVQAEQPREDEFRNIGNVGKSLKAKAEEDIRVSGDIKGKKKSFYHCVSGKWLNNENVGLQDG